MVTASSATPARLEVPYLNRSLRRMAKMHRHGSQRGSSRESVATPALTSCSDGPAAASTPTDHDWDRPRERGLSISIRRLVGISGQVYPKNDALAGQAQGNAEVKAQVKIKIMDYASGQPQELLIKPLACLIMPPRVHDGTRQKEPIDVPIRAEEMFFAERNFLTFLPNGSFGMSRRYRLDVYITAACSPAWPPPGVLDVTEDSRPKLFSLIASRIDLFEASRVQRTTHGYDYNTPASKTQYRLEVDLRWLLPSTQPAPRPRTLPAPSSPITVVSAGKSLSSASDGQPERSSKQALSNQTGSRVQSDCAPNPQDASTSPPKPTPASQSNKPPIINTASGSDTDAVSAQPAIKPEKQATPPLYTMNVNRHSSLLTTFPPIPRHVLPRTTDVDDTKKQSSPLSLLRDPETADMSMPLITNKESLPEPVTSTSFIPTVSRNGSVSGELSCDSGEANQHRLRERKQHATHNLEDLSHGRLREDTPDSDATTASKSRKSRKAPKSGTGLVKYYFDHCWVSRDRFRCLPCGQLHTSASNLTQHLHSAHKNIEFYLDQSQENDSHDSEAAPRIYIRPLPRLLALASAQHSSALGDPGLVASMTHVEPCKYTPDAPETFTVPNNGVAIYDHITHTQLTPDTQHTQPRLDKSWLIYRHQCALSDFTDITGAERAYILAWSTYALAHDTTRATVARIWLSFLHDHLAWLIASDELVHQVMHHAAALTACDVLDMDTHDAALRLVQQAWAAWAGRSNAPGMLLKRHGGRDADAAGPTPAAAVPGLAATIHSARPQAQCAACSKQILVGAWVVKCASAECMAEFHGRCLKGKGERGLFSRAWRCGKCKTA
ncbi:hypothetical protein BROUX41_004280 [Berkeleyomyces rouxiae]|uniref:uncharacterized protein n=1 Tax=Berkeleyomyces rouxiae TaxID=2035830 RepID=UPI003B795706